MPDTSGLAEGPSLDRIDAFYIECSLVEMYKGQPLLEDVIDAMRRHGFRTRRIGHVSRSATEPGVQADILFTKAEAEVASGSAAAQ